MTDTAIAELAPQVGVREACQAVGAAQAGYYRRHRHSPPPQRPTPVGHRERVQPRALSKAERQAILDSESSYTMRPGDALQVDGLLVQRHHPHRTPYASPSAAPVGSLITLRSPAPVTFGAQTG